MEASCNESQATEWELQAVHGWATSSRGSTQSGCLVNNGYKDEGGGGCFCMLKQNRWQFLVSILDGAFYEYPRYPEREVAYRLYCWRNIHRPAVLTLQQNTTTEYHTSTSTSTHFMVTLVYPECTCIATDDLTRRMRRGMRARARQRWSEVGERDSEGDN